MPKKYPTQIPLYTPAFCVALDFLPKPAQPQLMQGQTL